MSALRRGSEELFHVIKDQKTTLPRNYQGSLEYVQYDLVRRLMFFDLTDLNRPDLQPKIDLEEMAVILMLPCKRTTENQFCAILVSPFPRKNYVKSKLLL